MSGKNRKGLYLIKRILSTLLNLVYPSYCKLCGKKLKSEERIVCGDCIEKLNHFRFREPLIKLDENSVLYSFFIFEDTVKDFIHLFKYYGYIPVGKKMVELVEEKYELSFLKNYDYYLPVPLHKKRLRDRGFNQAELIGEWLFEKRNVEKLAFLERIKRGLPQASLTKAERTRNIKGSFVLKDALKNREVFKGRNVLVIDDILTSGATFFEIRKTLTPLEFNRIDILTLSTPRKS